MRLAARARAVLFSLSACAAPATSARAPVVELVTPASARGDASVSRGEPLRKPPVEEVIVVEPGGAVSLPGGGEASIDGKRVAISSNGDSDLILLEPGDAAVFHEWLVVRTASTARVEIRRRSATEHDGRSDVAWHIGERIRLGEWIFEWTTVRPSLEAPQLRAYDIDGRAAARENDRWAMASDLHERVGKFSSKDGLADAEMTVVSLKDALNARDVEMTVRVREVDRAFPAKLGAPVSTGLWVFPDGLRVSLFKRGACSSHAPCRFFLGGAAILPGGTVAIMHELQDGVAERAANHTFTMKNDRVVVTP